MSQSERSVNLYSLDAFQLILANRRLFFSTVLFADLLLSAWKIGKTACPKKKYRPIFRF